jgi:hypothetical protein
MLYVVAPAPGYGLEGGGEQNEERAWLLGSKGGNGSALKLFLQFFCFRFEFYRLVYNLLNIKL